MKYEYIADTTVWIEYFRQKDKVTGFIDNALDSGRLAIIGPIITELLQGIKSADESALILSCIDAVPIIETSMQVWINAGVLSNELRRRGVTLDKHFSYIKGVSTMQL